MVLRLAVSILSVLVVTAILKAVDPTLSDRHPYTLFFAAVAVTSWVAGFWASILTIGLSYLAADWFFILPRYSLNHAPSDLAGLAGFIFSGLAIAFTSRALHAARERAEAKQEALSREIAARTRMHEELVKAKAQLGHYAGTLEGQVHERTADLRKSLESLENVLYHVAHDLRAPLRAMHSFTNLLLEDYASQFDERGRDYGHRIVQASGKMDLLTHDLLEYGRLCHYNISWADVDLTKFINRLLAGFAPEIRNKRAEIQVDAPLAGVHGDVWILEQVVGNLIANALKFVPSDAAPRIHIWAEIHGQTVHLNIQDNGIGIAPEYQERIFKVFERLHSNEEIYPGTGIGLAIARKGMERLQGRVGVESQPGRWSRFWLELRKTEGGSFPSRN